MKKLASMTVLLMFAAVMFSSSVNAQMKSNKPRASLKAMVMQRIGVDTDITIDYSRPGVKGRKVWGDLVPWGMAPAGKEAKNPYPWRGGANENTTIEFSKDVMVDGNKLPAGKYSLHFIPEESEWTVIFNKNSKMWGSFTYDEKEDALRIKVKPVVAPMTEWLEYGFDDLAGTSCTAYLQWDKLRVPFKISTADKM